MTPGNGVFQPRSISNDKVRPTDIVWNFEKFIVDKFGNPRYRFLSVVEPDDIENILKALATESKSGKMEPSNMANIKNSLDVIEKKYNM